MKVYAIDQATHKLGHCLLDTVTGKSLVLGTVEAPEALPLIERIVHMDKEIMKVVDEQKPDLIAIEDYAYTKQSSADAMLKELGGVIKFQLYQRGIKLDRQAIVDGKPALVIQSSAAMKKFCLGKGNMSKDSRYLLTVMERMKKSFDDDNQADAYMHAFMAGMMASVLQGKVQVQGLHTYQQEVLIDQGYKLNKKRFKGMTINKVLTTSSEIELSKLVGH